MRIYKIHNPYSGMYVDVSNVAELAEVLAQQAWEAYMILTHNQPITVVDINDDGSQIWRSPQGDVYPTPEEIQEKMKKFAESQMAMLPLIVME